MLSDRLKGTDLEGSLHQLWDTAVNSATDARDAKGVGRVAGSIGPLFASYRPDICPSASDAEEIYREVTNLLASKTDLLLIETMSSIDQAEGALRAAIKTDVPVWLSLTVDDFDGTKFQKLAELPIEGGRTAFFRRTFNDGINDEPLELAYGTRLDTIQEVVDFLLFEKPTMTHVCLTGRNAKTELIEAADMVTDMEAIKHPFRDGIKAQKGIEF